MPIATREAEVVWEGPLASGTGTVSSGSGALGALPVTWASRTERSDGKTSPAELIAAAHASCFAMALSLVLGQNHTPPERLVVSAACTLDEVDGAPKVTTSELSVRARIQGIDPPGVERASALCPVSNALRGNVELSVHGAWRLELAWSPTREASVRCRSPRLSSTRRCPTVRLRAPTEPCGSAPVAASSCRELPASSCRELP